jgi:hypothetical protein
MAEVAQSLPLLLKVGWTAIVAAILYIYWREYGTENFRDFECERADRHHAGEEQFSSQEKARSARYRRTRGRAVAGFDRRLCISQNGGVAEWVKGNSL